MSTLSIFSEIIQSNHVPWQTSKFCLFVFFFLLRTLTPPSSKRLFRIIMFHGKHKTMSFLFFCFVTLTPPPSSSHYTSFCCFPAYHLPFLILALRVFTCKTKLHTSIVWLSQWYFSGMHQGNAQIENLS
jgi:hypothetical protein